jgi:hypothetical protein
MYGTLKKRLEIVCLKSESVDVNLPTVRDEWSDILKAALKVGGYQRSGDSELILEQAAKSENISGQVKSFTHCECKILRYFIAERLTPTPLSYIGVSNLACAGCSTVFRVWNNLHGDTKYLCRGSHGKWYFPWAMPDLNDSNNVANATYEDMAKKLGKSLLIRGQARFESDSSAPSFESGIPLDHPSTMALIEQSRAKRAAQLQKEDEVEKAKLRRS